jgi:hypothetical protein
VNKVTDGRLGCYVPLRFVPEREERTKSRRAKPRFAPARFTAIYNRGFA